MLWLFSRRVPVVEMAASERYNRQILQWGEKKQEKIEQANVLVAGLGGLGATVSQLLARAGVGRLYLVDDALVDWPDLNRQLLYNERDVGLPKRQVAQTQLAQINSNISIEVIDKRIDSYFCCPADITLAVDCLDNYTSRFKLEESLPPATYLVHGAIEGNQGQVLTIRKGNSQPLIQLFAGSRQPQGAIPVSGANAVTIAGLMVNEVFQVIFGQPNLLNRCLVIGLGDLHFSFLDI